MMLKVGASKSSNSSVISSTVGVNGKASEKVSKAQRVFW